MAIDPRFHDRPGVEFVVKVRHGGREDVAWSLVARPDRSPGAPLLGSRRRRPRALRGQGPRAGAGDAGLREGGRRGPGLLGHRRRSRSRARPRSRSCTWWTRCARTTPGSTATSARPLPSSTPSRRTPSSSRPAVAHASWTKPSVASILTSHLPGQHRAVQLRDPLDPQQVTLAQRLDARGFATGAAIANSVIYGAESAFDRGFDLFAGLHGDDDTRSKLVGADVVVDQALAFLRSRRGLPTFLYVHTMDPHVPYAPPAPFDRMFEPHATDAHPARDPRTDYKEPLDRERMIAQYDGDVAFGDREFGRFVRELKALGLYDDALVVFLADHGEEFQDHGLWLHGRSLFDELIHIPLVVKFPGKRAARARASRARCRASTWRPPCSRRCRSRSRPISPGGRCSARSSATSRRARRSPRSATAASWPTACARRTRSTSAASAPTTTSCCSTCAATRTRRRASPRGAPSGCACARPRSRPAWPRTRSATCCRRAARAGSRCGSRRTAGSRRSSSPASGRRSARSWAATGERWTWRCSRARARRARSPSPCGRSARRCSSRARATGDRCARSTWRSARAASTRRRCPTGCRTSSPRPSATAGCGSSRRLRRAAPPSASG